MNSFFSFIYITEHILLGHLVIGFPFPRFLFLTFPTPSSEWSLIWVNPTLPAPLCIHEFNGYGFRLFIYIMSIVFPLRTESILTSLSFIDSLSELISSLIPLLCPPHTHNTASLRWSPLLEFNAVTSNLAFVSAALTALLPSSGCPGLSHSLSPQTGSSSSLFLLWIYFY